MAGGASVWAAAEAPDLVAGQVLIDAFVRDHPAEQSNTFVSNLMIKAAFAGPWAVPVWSMYYKSLYPTAPPADLATYRGALKENLRESGRLDALKAMMAASKDDSEARLDAVHAPTFVVFGTKDPDFTRPAAEAQWLATRLNGSLLMVDGAGHYPHAEMPAQVGPAIVSFLHGQRADA
jgi:pimeloyl-ACP methyl ester carboxylesterase